MPEFTDAQCPGDSVSRISISWQRVVTRDMIRRQLAGYSIAVRSIHSSARLLLSFSPGLFLKIQECKVRYSLETALQLLVFVMYASYHVYFTSIVLEEESSSRHSFWFPLRRLSVSKPLSKCHCLRPQVASYIMCLRYTRRRWILPSYRPPSRLVQAFFQSASRPLEGIFASRSNARGSE